MRLVDADALREHYLNTTDCALVCIDEAPTIDAVEQKHGHWIKLDEDDYGDTYKCSNCNTCFYGVVDPDDSLCNFCLTCGAKMDEVLENEG